MINSWVLAVLKFNKGKDVYCIPKKGTKQYKQVKKIQETISEEDVEKARKKIREKKAKKANK